MQGEGWDGMVNPCGHSDHKISVFWTTFLIEREVKIGKSDLFGQAYGSNFAWKLHWPLGMRWDDCLFTDVILASRVYMAKSWSSKLSSLVLRPALGGNATPATNDNYFTAQTCDRNLLAGLRQTVFQVTVFHRVCAQNSRAQPWWRNVNHASPNKPA